MLEGMNEKKDCVEGNYRTILGKITEIINQEEWTVETLDKENSILVNLTNDTVYEEDISHEFELGNIVMFEIIDTVVVSDSSCKSTITKMLANDKDRVIAVDKRETISGYLGIFPDEVLDMQHHQITVKEDSIVAVVLKQKEEESFEYEKDDEHLVLLSKGEEPLNDQETEHYWGFVAKNAGEHPLTFLRINKDNEVIEKISLLIIVESNTDTNNYT